MDETAPFDQAVDRGNRFLGRGNFLLAKQAFEEASRMRAAPELQESMVECDRGLLALKRREAIKKGRRLEQKGKWAEALVCFEQAAAWDGEAWLTERIALLQQKCTLATVEEQVRSVTGSVDMEAQLAVYAQAVVLDPQPITVNRQATCLLQLRRPKAVVDLYACYPPVNDLSRYLLGLAHAQLASFGDAVTWWAQVTEPQAEWQAQWRGWIPFVYRALQAEPPGPPAVAVYRFICRLQKMGAHADFLPYEVFFHIQALAAWWSCGVPDGYADLLESWPATLTPAWLGQYARIYFKLAQRDARYLETAISLWLTAIYQDGLLDALSAHVLFVTPIDRQTLRTRLLQAMEQVLAMHERAGTLVPGIRAWWRVETQSIMGAARFAGLGEQPEIFPCTLGFADRFGESAAILALLQQHRAALDDGGEWFWELLAAFSPFRSALLGLERGDLEKSLTFIPSTAHDELANYCRQRVQWAMAVKTLTAGRKGARKGFLAAMPLVQKYPNYAEALVPLAFADLETHLLQELGEVMELFVPHAVSPKFCEATAHLIGTKAMQLLYGRPNFRTVEALLDRADQIFRGTEMVKAARATLHRDMAFEQFVSAMRKRNVIRAAQIVQDTNLPELTSNFFAGMEHICQTVSDWELEEQIVPLREFDTACRLVDPRHPVTKAVGHKLAALLAK